MKMLAFAVLFLSLRVYAGAQQITLLESEGKNDPKKSEVTDDGMPSVTVPKEDETPAAVPVEQSTAEVVSPVPSAPEKKVVKKVINKRKKSAAVAVSSEPVTSQPAAAPQASAGSSAVKPEDTAAAKNMALSTAPAAFPFESVKPQESPSSRVPEKTAAAAIHSEAVKPAAAVNPAPAAKPAEKAKPAAVQAAPVVAGAGFAVAKTHTVSGGDTLWGLSGKYYKDPYRWGKIYNANLDKMKNPDHIYPSEVLVIPGLKEEVKPVAAKTPVGGGDTVKEAELSSSDVSRPAEASVQAPAASVTAPAFAPAKTAKAELGDMLKEFDSNDLSEEMPEHQKEWSSDVNIVPDGWKEDGVISSADKGENEEMDNSLSSGGDIILVVMREQVSVNKGDYLEVYLKGSIAFDKAGKKIGREIQPAGTLQVLSSEGRQVRARVIDALTAIIKGYVVKKK